MILTYKLYIIYNRGITTIHKMPEGPEVRVTAEAINNEIAGDYITYIQVNKSSRYHKSGINNHYCVSYPLEVSSVDSKGKKIRFHCYDNDGNSITIISALAMEGNWKLYSGKHAGIELHMESGKVLYFHDTRHFGTFHICVNDDEYDFVMKDVGPDLLNEDISFEEFDEVISRYKLGKKEICWFLMEQKFFSGVGNYLLAEILYASRVLPYRTLNTLSEDEKYDIWSNTTRLIRESYESGGMTIATYFSMDGSPGSFSCVCYGNKYDPNGYPILRGTFSNGRTSWYCPDMQN